MHLFGHLLLWIGFLAAAFVSVSRLERADDKWSTIPWLWYVAAMAVGIVGIVVLRTARRKSDEDRSQTDAEYSVVRRSLTQASAIVEQLSRQREHDPADVLRRIDDQCAEPFADFADARQALVKRFGLQVYADVMTEFAAAERYVNRSWSAAADGYVDEVAASLKRANQHLQNTTSLIAEAESNA